MKVCGSKCNMNLIVIPIFQPKIVNKSLQGSLGQVIGKLTSSEVDMVHITSLFL